MTVLVVGAGFAGAVHARLLAEAGIPVQVIDKRPHIGGNAFDYVESTGVRVHAYGPHLFHTKNIRVVDWLSRFAEMAPYRHVVRAKLVDGRMTPLPINLETINTVFGTSFNTAEEVARHLEQISLKIHEPRNALEYLYSNIGVELTEIFFRPYTLKMWALDLEDMSSAVVRRIPLRMDRTDGYFTADETQVMPVQGFAAMFAEMLNHPLIEVDLEVAFDRADLDRYEYCFNSMPIDEFYEFRHGDLPYRSIRFHPRTEPAAVMPAWSVTNFTDNGPYTRETVWDAIPHHRVRPGSQRTVTKEEPCDYRDNHMERYYPVKTADGRFQKLYEEYRDLARRERKIQFIGRCGTYQYLDMDQVINQSLISAERWLATR